MAVIERTGLPEPVIRKKTVPVPALGADVVCTGLLLSDLLRLGTRGTGDRDYKHVCETLAVAVLAADGLPLWTARQWEMWGGTHTADVMMLYGEINQLCGVAEQGEAAKND